MELLTPWTEGPFTLKEALERYGEKLVGEALANGILKVVNTRLGAVLVPGARGRVLMGKTRYYTPRPSTLENALLVRRYMERLMGQGYRVLTYNRERGRALLEGNGERVLVVGSLRGGSRPQLRDPVESGADRILVLVPEGQGLRKRRKQVEVAEVRLGDH
ncbi:MAG: hypothetical protein P3W93_008105 [Thermus sp.]|nr:hypothetical protein [Thermus sp.]